MNPIVVSNITQKRLAGDLRLIRKEPSEFLDTYPDEKNTLLWYFVLRGLDSTEYDGGFYIGKVLHDPEYPVKPPNFVMLTPNGRFDIEKNICLTNSGYHSESWSAAWNMKSMLLGILSIMADDSTNGLSHIKNTTQQRKELAKKSVEYNKKHLNSIWLKFERFVNSDGTAKTSDEIRNDIKLFQEKNKPKVKTEPKLNEEKTEENDTEKIKDVKDIKDIKDIKDNVDIEKLSEQVEKIKLEKTKDDVNIDTEKINKPNKKIIKKDIDINIKNNDDVIVVKPKRGRPPKNKLV